MRAHLPKTCWWWPRVWHPKMIWRTTLITLLWVVSNHVIKSSSLNLASVKVVSNHVIKSLSLEPCKFWPHLQLRFAELLAAALCFSPAIIIILWPYHHHIITTVGPQSMPWYILLHHIIYTMISLFKPPCPQLGPRACHGQLDCRSFQQFPAEQIGDNVKVKVWMWKWSVKVKVKVWEWKCESESVEVKVWK